MTLRFIGIDPETSTGNSPTVWVDESTHEVVIQGWKPGPQLEAECEQFEVPGHSVGIPADEAVIRIPARLAPALRKACDVAEGTGLH